MDPARLRSAPANYAYLRGLLLVPGGLLILLAALGNWKVAPFDRSPVFLAAVGVLAAVAAVIQNDYNRHYGRLRLSGEQQLRATGGVAAAIVVVTLGSLLLRSRASWSLDLPVNALAATLAAVMLITYAVGVGIKTHHLVIWGTVLVAGALPVWSGGDPSNIGLTVVAGATVVDGLFNHRLFVRAFGPRRLDADGQQA